MKTVYIARHAEAVPVGYPHVHSDFDRHLTPAGLALLERQARALRYLEADIQACYSSPLVRARQTAEQLAGPYGCEVQTHEALGNAPYLSGVAGLLAETEARSLLLVTHQPFVVQLTSWLLTGDSEVVSHFGTASVACLRLHLLEPAPRGELQWLLTAEMMARIDK